MFFLVVQEAAPGALQKIAKDNHMLLVEVGDSSDPQLSSEKNPGWLGYIGDYTTQLYRDYNKPI